MSGRTTLALVATALALGAYIYLIEIGGEERRAEAESASKRVLAIEADAVSGLGLPLRDGRRARLALDGEVWRLEEPLVFPADQGRVTSILDALAQLESKSVFEDPPDDLEPFGLGAGAARIEILLDGEAPLVLALGAETPIPGGVYARLESDPSRIYTIDLYRSERLRPELDDLRESRILSLRGDDVDTVRVEEGKRLVARLERVEAAEPGGTDPPLDTQPEWRVLEPLSDRGDRVRIRRLIQDLTLARASEFVDSPGALSTYGLASPEVRVELGSGETRERIAFGRAGDKAYARRDDTGPVFEIHARTLNQVPRELFAYRHKEVLSLEPLDVQQLELHFPRDNESASFVRDAGGWRLAGEEADDEADPMLGERVDDLLFTLEYVEATSVEDDADREALGLAVPAVRVVALDEKGGELGWLELADPEPGEGMAVISSDSERVWRVLNDLADSIPVGAAAYRNRWLAPPEEPDLAQDPAGAEASSESLGSGEDLE